MNISGSIITGVISGIITSTMILFLINIFNKIVIPWYRSAIYNGIDISDTWEKQIDYSGTTDYTSIDLKQRKRNITGTMAVVEKSLETEDITNKTILYRWEISGWSSTPPRAQSR